MGERTGTRPGRRRARPDALIGAFALVVAAVGLAALAIGPSSASLADLAALAAGRPVEASAANILLNVRLPRLAAGLLAGAALAVSGALIQAALDNPLASPNIVGVNGGAGLAVLAVSALPAFQDRAPAGLLPLAAFAGAALAAAVIFTVSLRAGVSRLTVVLAGVAVNAVCTAGSNAVLAIAPNVYTGSTSYLVGGLSGVLPPRLAAPAALIAAGLAAALALAPHLNALSLGSEAAHAVGVRVGAVRIAALAAAALLAGAAVSFAGLIGFVGLLAPHAVRRLAGADNRLVVPLCALAGAGFTVACDTFARTAFAPYELPVGIVLGFLGGAFFLYLLMRGRGYRDA